MNLSIPWLWVLLAISILVFIYFGYSLFVRGTVLSSNRNEESKASRFVFGALALVLSGIVGFFSGYSLFVTPEEVVEAAQSGGEQDSEYSSITVNGEELNLNLTRPVTGVTASGRLIPCTAEIYDERADFKTGGALYCQWDEGIQLTSGFSPEALISIIGVSALTYVPINDVSDNSIIDCLSTDPDIQLKLDNESAGEIYPLSMSCSNGVVPSRIAEIEEVEVEPVEPQSGAQSGAVEVTVPDITSDGIDPVESD